MRRRHTADERMRFVDEVQRSGESVPIVAARLGVGLSTAYRWAQGIRRGVAPTEFVQVFPKTVRAKASVFVHVGAARIEVEDRFDRELLSAVVAALSTGS